jgi:hypothetical protein
VTHSSPAAPPSPWPAASDRGDPGTKQPDCALHGDTPASFGAVDRKLHGVGVPTQEPEPPLIHWHPGWSTHVDDTVAAPHG